jgi:hypothetical protein
MSSTRSFASPMSATVVTSVQMRLMWTFGAELTKFLSHVNAGHHFNLGRIHNRSNYLGIILDGRCALHQPGKSCIMEVKLKIPSPEP